MKEYIERAVAIERARNEFDLINKSHWSADEIVDFLKRLPAAEVVEVRHGRWIKNDNGTWSCERCHSWIPDEQHYYARFCLYCGAKMDGGGGDAAD